MTDLEADILEREVPEIIIIDSKAKGLKYLFDSRKDRFAIAGKKGQSIVDDKTGSYRIRRASRNIRIKRFYIGKNKAMIERKEFLMMCQKNSVYPRSCKIIYHDAEYYPLALYIWFDDKGNPHNTAVIEQINSNSITYGKLQEVEKYED